MKAEFYQVIGSGPCPIDYPNGTAVSHRPGEVIEARPTNKSVIRALRTGRLRMLSIREAAARRAAKQVVAVKPKAAPSPAPRKIEKAEPAKGDN